MSFSTKATRSRAKPIAILRGALSALYEQSVQYEPALAATYRRASDALGELEAGSDRRAWIPVGLRDRHGRAVHLGDVLEFDREEWYRHLLGADHGPVRFTVELNAGAITYRGTAADVGEWCSIVESPGFPLEAATD